MVDVPLIENSDVSVHRVAIRKYTCGHEKPTSSTSAATSTGHGVTEDEGISQYVEAAPGRLGRLGWDGNDLGTFTSL